MQHYVFLDMESPPYTFHVERRYTFSKFDKGFINITMTHRSDSHIHATYRLSQSLSNIILKGEGKRWVESKLAKKKKLAVSNYSPKPLKRLLILLY